MCVCEREREKGRQKWTEVIVKVMLDSNIYISLLCLANARLFYSTSVILC